MCYLRECIQGLGQGEGCCMGVRGAVKTEHLSIHKPLVSMASQQLGAGSCRDIWERLKHPTTLEK
jgi:hypothetical protein